MANMHSQLGIIVIDKNNTRFKGLGGDGHLARLVTTGETPVPPPALTCALNALSHRTFPGSQAPPGNPYLPGSAR
jgi:hypothetical protein